MGAQTTSAPTSITVTPAQASLYFIQADHLNTPRLVTDEANAIVWRYLPTTEPFGNTPPEEDPNATGKRFEMPLAFPGQYRDRESNLNYNYFRDYNPATGRYVQSDPIGLQGGINTYTYVEGDPISYVDLDGLSRQNPFDPNRFGGGGSGGSARMGSGAAGGGARASEGGASRGANTPQSCSAEVSNSAKPLYRNMSKAEAEAVQQTGKLRGGKEGDTFFTDSRFRSADTAQDRLSLPNRPEVQMEFRIKNSPSMTRNGTRVDPEAGGRGGGREYMTTNPVEVEIINVQPYR